MLTNKISFLIKPISMLVLFAFINSICAETVLSLNNSPIHTVKNQFDWKNTSLTNTKNSKSYYGENRVAPYNYGDGAESQGQRYAMKFKLIFFPVTLLIAAGLFIAGQEQEDRRFTVAGVGTLALGTGLAVWGIYDISKIQKMRHAKRLCDAAWEHKMKLIEQRLTEVDELEQRKDEGAIHGLIALLEYDSLIIQNGFAKGSATNALIKKGKPAIKHIINAFPVFSETKKETLVKPDSLGLRLRFRKKHQAHYLDVLVGFPGIRFQNNYYKSFMEIYDVEGEVSDYTCYRKSVIGNFFLKRLLFGSKQREETVKYSRERAGYDALNRPNKKFTFKTGDFSFKYTIHSGAFILSEITGEKFGTDRAKWADWWNEQNPVQQPRVIEAARKPVDTDKQESETSEKDLKTGYQTRIILNSGKEFNGVLVEYSDDKLILDIKGSRITFAKNAIQNIIQ